MRDAGCLIRYTVHGSTEPGMDEALGECNRSISLATTDYPLTHNALRITFDRFTLNQLLDPPLELGAGHKHPVVALHASHTDVGPDPHHAPIEAAAGVRLAQRVYIPKPDVHRLHFLCLPILTTYKRYYNIGGQAPSVRRRTAGLLVETPAVLHTA